MAGGGSSELRALKKRVEVLEVRLVGLEKRVQEIDAGPGVATAVAEKPPPAKTTPKKATISSTKKGK